MLPPVFIRKGYKGQTAYSQVYLGGECIGAARAKATAKCPDPEKLATMLSIQRALHVISKYGVVLPPTARAVLGLASQLTKLRYEAMLSGDPNKAGKAKRVLEAAKHNPSRVVRAAAAAMQELLS